MTDDTQELANKRKREIIDAANHMDVDVVVYDGLLGIDFDATTFSRLVRQRKQREAVFLLLSTNGGAAETAYRIARCLRRSYSQFTIGVEAVCKSAGTLLALAADELVMWDNAELGPLDVQLMKPDHLFQRESGLTPVAAIDELRRLAFESFASYMLDIIRLSGHAVTTRTASEIAVKMAVGLFSPAFGQIDAMKLGETQRAVSIARAYGERLSSSNVLPDTIDRLVKGYPYHEFVIDREEAATLFAKVREPHDDECNLADMLRKNLGPTISSGPLVDYVSHYEQTTGNDP